MGLGSSLKCEHVEGKLKVTDALLSEFESKFGNVLPKEYKGFLKEYGSSFINGCISIKEPNPFGGSTIVDSIYGFNENSYSCDLREENETADGAPTLLPIAGNLFGGQFFLFCSGENLGEIFYWDIEQRASWPESKFYNMHENLSPAIEDYLIKRKNNRIPSKSEEYQDLYLVSENIKEFVTNLRVAQ